MIRSNLVFFSICFGLLCLSSYAAEQTDTPVIIQSVRTQSMGSAFTAVADSEDLLFFNPSGLPSIEDSRLTMFGIGANFNTDTIDALGDFIDAYDKADNSRDLSVDSINELKKYKPLISLAGPLQITYIRPRFGFSFLNLNINARANFSYANNESSVKINNTNEVVAMLAYGRRVYDNLSAGLLLKYLTKAEIRDTELSDLSDDKAIIYVRNGLGYDLGLMYELDRWSLKFGLAIRDLLNSSLTEQEIDLDNGDINDGEKYEIKRQATFGISYQPDFKIPWRKLAYYPESIILALDVGGGDSFSTVHFGGEIKMFRWLALRFGVNKGIRLGLGLRSGMFQLDYMFSPKMTDAYLDEEVEGNHAFSMLFRY